MWLISINVGVLQNRTTYLFRIYINMSSTVELGGGKYVYDSKKLLGHGSFGVVYLGRVNDPSRKSVAVKCIICKDDSRESLMRVFNEATILLTLKHENIVQTYNCYPVS